MIGRILKILFLIALAVLPGALVLLLIAAGIQLTWNNLKDNEETEEENND